jgi:hypothetical protein
LHKLGPRNYTSELGQKRGPRTGIAEADGVYILSSLGSCQLNIIGGTLDNNGPLVLSSGEPLVAVAYSASTPSVLNNDGLGTNGIVQVQGSGTVGTFENTGGTATVGSFVNYEATFTLGLTGSSGESGVTNVNGTDAGFAIYDISLLTLDSNSKLNINSSGESSITTAYIDSGIISNNSGGELLFDSLAVTSDSAGSGIIYAGTGSNGGSCISHGV